MTSRAKFNLHVNDEHRLLVLRPIGAMAGSEIASRTVEFYRSLDAPWTYNRIVDFRRYDAYVSREDLDFIAAGWADITAGVQYRAYVAMVVREAYEKLRLPEVSQRFPNETICYFSDYHEAVGWLQAVDQTRYLANLGALPLRARDGETITIQ